MSETENMEQFLMGMIAALMLRRDVRDVLRPFTIDRTDAGDALVLHIPDSGNTYRIEVLFVGNFEDPAIARTRTRSSER